MPSSEFVVVDTEYGPVKGLRKQTVLGLDYINFQGIPYMKAPLGKLRFRDAQPPEKWTEPIEPIEISYPDLDFVKNTVVGQEDGGIINVYTKNIQPEKKLPVMVWVRQFGEGFEDVSRCTQSNIEQIHGGGFQAGSSRTDFYGPDYILQKDVVLVSFNYRCGAFGFLSFDDPELGVPGNTGLKDQTFALKWVQRNIEKFGGDPGNVTIFGESAGGASVHYHMISEHSRGLFHKAIPMSGVAFNNAWTLQPRRNWAFRLANSLGYEGSQKESDILEFLESADPFKISDPYGNTKKLLTPLVRRISSIFPSFIWIIFRRETVKRSLCHSVHKSSLTCQKTVSFRKIHC
jgi:cholinesterase